MNTQKQPLPRRDFLRRTHVWRWLRRGLTWGLALLLVLNVAGVLLTARHVAVEWEPIVTTELGATCV